MTTLQSNGLRICLMSSCYALSEEDRHASFLVESNRYLRQRGVRVSVFAPSYRGLRDHSVDGVEVRRFRYFFRRWENLTHMDGAPTRVRNPLYLGVAAFYVLLGLLQGVRYCLRKRFDIIHVHWPFPHAIWGYVASRLTGAPMVLTFHGAEVLLCRKFFFVKYFLRHAARHAAAIICNSSFTAQQVRELGVDVPIEVIPFGVTLDVQPVVKDGGKPIKQVLFSGRLIERKGVEHLLRATPALLERLPVHIHIVGEGSIRPRLERLAADLGVSEHVTFHGFVSNEELARRYTEADVFVLPAIVDERGDTEGLGVVLIEAISYRTPLVASNVGGIVDIIKHEQTGLLVPQGDSPALANAITRVLSDDTLRPKLIEQGMAHVKSYLDWQPITNRLMAVYERVAKKPRASEVDKPVSLLADTLSSDASLDAVGLAVATSPGETAGPPRTGAPPGTAWKKLAVRAVISFCLLAMLFSQISPAAVIDNLKRVSFLFILFAWAYYALCQWISAYRWQLLLRAKNVHVTIGKLFSMYMIGMFVNNFMPGSLGGDVVKSYYLFRRTREMELAVVSVFLERFTGLVGLSLLSVAALPFAYRYIDSWLLLWAVVGTMAALIIIVILLWQLPNIVRRVPRLLRLMPQRLLAVATGIYKALLSYRAHPATVLVSIGISVALQLLFALYYALASVAMGIPIDLIYFVLFLPAVSLISLMPLSVGGLGLREATMVLLFGAAGIAPADVLAVALTVHLINTFLSLWGGVLLVARPRKTTSLGQAAPASISTAAEEAAAK